MLRSGDILVLQEHGVKLSYISLLLVLTAFLMSCSVFNEKYDPPYRIRGSEEFWSDATNSKPLIPTEWLTKRVSIQNVDIKLKADLEKLQSAMKPGDELWEFKSPPETWRMFAGVAGYAIVRDGTPVGGVVTYMN